MYWRFYDEIFSPPVEINERRGSGSVFTGDQCVHSPIVGEAVLLLPAQSETISLIHFKRAKLASFGSRVTVLAELTARRGRFPEEIRHTSTTLPRSRNLPPCRTSTYHSSSFVYIFAKSRDLRLESRGTSLKTEGDPSSSFLFAFYLVNSDSGFHSFSSLFILFPCCQSSHQL